VRFLSTGKKEDKNSTIAQTRASITVSNHDQLMDLDMGIKREQGSK